MKRIIFVALALVMTTMAFGQKPVKLQIVYFHAKNRCPTCLSIEENTKKTLNTYFAAQLKDGTIKLQVLDVSEEKNEKIVEKYQADGSGLFLTHLDGKKETTTDFTNFAFSYSRNQADKFIAGLKAEIEKNLK
ncbi:MAG: nitrophenyl compound nitroreductase subunit ArsF family protein [Bacteroidota bacterium]